MYSFDCGVITALNYIVLELAPGGELFDQVVREAMMSKLTAKSRLEEFKISDRLDILLVAERELFLVQGGLGFRKVKIPIYLIAATRFHTYESKRSFCS